MDLSPHAPTRRCLLGVSIDAFTMEQATKQCTDALEHDEYISIGVVNAAKIVAMRRDPQLKEAVGGCRHDPGRWAVGRVGQPYASGPAARTSGGHRPIPGTARRAAQRSGDACTSLARARMSWRADAQPSWQQVPRAPRCRSPGWLLPSRRGRLRWLRRSAAAGRNAVRRHLLAEEGTVPEPVGEATEAHVVHGVGGSFDVLAGLTRRAPLWYQKHGLEWLYRAKQEPLRLGRRYLTTNVSFIALVAREMLRRRRGRTVQIPTNLPYLRPHRRSRRWPRRASMTAVVVVGLGYVGLPLAMRAAEVGHRVVGYDIDEARVKLLAVGRILRRGRAVRAADGRRSQLGTFRPSSDARRVRRVRRRGDRGADAAARRASRPLLRRGRGPHAGRVPAARGAPSSLESTTYPGTTEELVAAPPGGRFWPDRRARLPPRLQPRAHRPGQHDLDAREPRRRSSPGSTTARSRRSRPSTTRSSTRPSSVSSPARGRAGQAAREHLPAREHRPGQRAGHVRPRPRHRRVGGDRRRLDQAVRLHAVHPGTGGGRPLPADRPVLPLVAGRAGRWARASGSSSWPTTSTATCRTTSCTAS